LLIKKFPHLDASDLTFATAGGGLHKRNGKERIVLKVRGTARGCVLIVGGESGKQEKGQAVT
jgi:hypothetical protein